MEKVTEDALFLRFKDQSNALIDAHRPRILKAFKNADDQKLSISLSIEVRPSKAAGVLDVEVGIGYVVERVKEKTVSTVSNQLSLPMEETTTTYMLKKPTTKAPATFVNTGEI
jgi:hypothetical protein